MRNAFLGFLGVLVVGFFVSCASVTMPKNGAGLTATLVPKNYEILKVVSTECRVHNVLGLFTWGGGSYSFLLEKAKAECGADDVMNIYRDVSTTTILLVYNTYTVTLTGTAIKYVK